MADINVVWPVDIINGLLNPDACTMQTYGRCTKDFTLVPIVFYVWLGLTVLGFIKYILKKDAVISPAMYITVPAGILAAGWFIGALSLGLPQGGANVVAGIANFILWLGGLGAVICALAYLRTDIGPAKPKVNKHTRDPNKKKHAY